MIDKDIVRESGIYLMYDDVDEITARELTQFILEHNFKGEVDRLTIMINSYGGDCASAFAIIDMMKASRIPIDTIGTGIVSSSALFIFMTGDKRVLRPNTEILSHQFSTTAEGKDHEVEATTAMNKNIREMITKHYVKHTKLSKKTVTEELLPPSDVWLTPKEAVAYNLADRVK